mgnify:CR=1 FL=1
MTVKGSLQDLYNSSHLSGGNASWIEGVYEDWLQDERSVPEQWARAFAALRDRAEGLGGASGERGHLGVQEKFRHLGSLPPGAAADSQWSDRKEASVVRLITAYRLRGHENAGLNPLGEPHSAKVPDLDPAFHELAESDLDREFDSGSRPSSAPPAGRPIRSSHVTVPVA